MVPICRLCVGGSVKKNKKQKNEISIIMLVSWHPAAGAEGEDPFVKQRRRQEAKRENRAMRNEVEGMSRLWLIVFSTFEHPFSDIFHFLSWLKKFCYSKKSGWKCDGRVLLPNSGAHE